MSSKEEEYVKKIKDKLSKYPKVIRMFELLENNAKIQAYITAANQMAVTRLGYNDHGRMHSLIASNNSIDIFEILTESVTPNLVKEKLGTYEDSLLVSFTATYLHDIGHVVHRTEHNFWSVILARPILEELLTEIYDDIVLRTHVLSGIVHGIFTHDESQQSLTVEAGIVKLADGTDIAEGRSRIPYSLGKVDIHSVSALAIKEVHILKGETRPLKILIEMENPAGIFQVEYILGRKLNTSGLVNYVDLAVFVNGKEIQLSNFY